MKAQKHLRIGLLLSCLLCSAALAKAKGKSQAIGSADSAPHLRTYYLCAEEIDWDYTPDGKDMMMRTGFDGYSRVFTEHTEKRIGHTYRKAVFHEYTDATFTTLKPRPAALSHMGLLGPVIRAEVGDTIKVVLRNNASFPFSLHPHGVSYDRDSEGAMYADGMEHPEANGLVPPGKTAVPSRGSITLIITNQKT
jgi:FtsP/CotA-like multicopper oxidase with cupredoxin domain